MWLASRAGPIREGHPLRWSFLNRNGIQLSKNVASQRGLGIGGGSKVMGLPNGVYETSPLHLFDPCDGGFE